VEQTGKPAFELILSGLESAPADKPFEPEQLNLLRGLQRAAKDHYARILNGMLGVEPGALELPTPLVRGAQMLHRRIANAFGQASLRLALLPAADQNDIGLFALSSFESRTEEIKWHAFERTTAPAVSWQNANALFLGIESIGIDREPLHDGVACANAFAHCVLLATLNVGILSPPQVELAYRWLAKAGRELRVEPFFDPDTHWYQIDLEQPRGPERISPESAVSDTTRFFAVSVLGPALAQARVRLYTGALDVVAPPNRLSALHFGSFLDLAERLWSPDWRRASWRDARSAAKGENIEIVIGFESVVEVLGEDDGEENAAVKQASWMLRDRSDTGLGARVPDEIGASIQPGALIAYRESAEEDWELGAIVRRVRSADEIHWLVGIKRISSSSVALRLQAHSDTLQIETEAAPDPQAIYASVNSSTGRVDSLLVRLKDFQRNANYRLPTRNGAFRIRMNRVIERGDDWMRVGFEVLGK
jgi:hypothetical protein